MIETTTNVSLRDAMYALSLSKKVPDAELVDDFARRYPQYAGALTDFAIELAVDGSMHDDEDEFELPGEPERISPVVSRVMSIFENRLFEVREGRAAKGARASSIDVENRLATLDRERFRKLATRVGGNTVFLSKLRDRQIDPVTIPDRYCSHVADEMGDPLDLVMAHLYAPPQKPVARQFYKADRKPAAIGRQTFEEAVRGSGLSNEQQIWLLAFRD